MLLAVTSKDEVNLISCLAATRMGVDYTIARISNPDYYARGSVLSRERLGIDLMINPEREAAKETFQLLQSAAATDVANFAHGQVQLMGLGVKEGRPGGREIRGPLAAELKDFHFVLVAIVRDGETIIPDGLLQGRGRGPHLRPLPHHRGGRPSRLWPDTSPST